MRRLLAVLVAVAVTQCAFADEDRQELRGRIRKLRNDLLNKTRYDPWIKPLINATDKIPVRMHIELIQPPVLDTASHLFEVAGITCMTWSDVRLRWDPSQYDHLDTLSLRRDEVWAPMLTQMNPREALSRAVSLGKVAVSPDGRVQHCFHTSTGATCTTDLSNFPYDKHECFITYYGGEDVDKDAFQATITPTNIRGEFDMVNDSAGIRVIESQEGYVFEVVQFHFVMERCTRLYHYTITVPVAAASVLSFLVFWLHPGSDRKVTLAGFSLLIAVFLLYRTSEAVSGSTQVPKLVKVLGALTLIDSFVILSAIISMNMAKRSPAPSCRPASFVVKLCEGTLGRLLCVCAPPFSEKEARGDTAGFEANREWFLAAQVTDRLLFVLLLVVYVGIIC